MKNKYRRDKKRDLKRRIAAVGEGPTEWHFVNSFNQVENLRISLKPSLPQSSNYRAIFKKARTLLDQGFDQIYCLIDLDTCRKSNYEFEKYKSEKQKIIKAKKIKVYETMPCMEFWFLLYFIDFSTRAYRNCSEVEKELKKYISNYEKTNAFFKKINIYRYLAEKGDQNLAETNAKKLISAISDDVSQLSPFTQIHEFISDLRKESKLLP